MAYLDGTTRLGPGGGPRSPVSFSAAAATAAITGTADGATEKDIVAGGKTIIITLTNDTWVAEGATFNAQRQAIIDGLDSAQSETLGWNNEVRDTEDVAAVVRTSDTVVTITLTEAAGYDITASEVITVTVPAAALVTSASEVIATPTLEVVPAAATGGRSRGTKRRYSVEIEGEFFVFDSIAQVEAFLAEVRETADESADALVTTPVTPKPPRIKVKTGSGKPTTSVTIQREVKRTQKRVNQAFREAAKRRAVDQEISELLIQKIEKDDDEQNIIALLLLS